MERPAFTVCICPASREIQKRDSRQFARRWRLANHTHRLGMWGAGVAIKRAAAKLPTRGEARRISVNVATWSGRIRRAKQFRRCRHRGREGARQINSAHRAGHAAADSIAERVARALIRQRNDHRSGLAQIWHRYNLMFLRCSFFFLNAATEKTTT